MLKLSFNAFVLMLLASAASLAADPIEFKLDRKSVV